MERGWNDPPVFLYNSGATLPSDSTSSATSKRHPLTKRIAFSDAPVANSNMNVGAGLKEPLDLQTCPLPVAENSLLPPPQTSADSTGADDALPQVQLFPPTSTTELPQFVAPIIVPTMVHGVLADGAARPAPVVATNPVSGVCVAADETADVLQIPNFDDDEQMFHYVITRLQRALRDCQTVVESKVVDDIQKKVNVLSDMWKNGKVSYPVKSTMARLSTAIHRRQCTIANELHLYLMIDHVSEVSKWLVGIKRLIQEVEKVEQPLSPSASCFPATTETPVASDEVQPTHAVGDDRTSSEKPAECPSPGETPVDAASEGNDSPGVVTNEPASCGEIQSAERSVAENDDVCDNSQFHEDLVQEPPCPCLSTKDLPADAAETVPSASDIRSENARSVDVASENCPSSETLLN